VELSLKHQKKTYNFEDLAKAVWAANKGNVHLKKMRYSDFSTVTIKSTNRKSC